MIDTEVIIEEERGSRKWIIPVVILVIVLLAFISYRWIIPRTELEIRTIYHEAIAGGGTGGSINVNVLLTNEGNREVTDLTCSVIITQKGEGTVTEQMVEDVALERGDNTEIKIRFTGNQFSTYVIHLQVDFISSGEDHSGAFTHETHEDVMNILFLDTLG